MTLSKYSSKIFSFTLERYKTRRVRKITESHRRRRFSRIGLFVSVTIILSLASDIAFSQQTDTVLEQRVGALEDYVATIQPTLVELSDNLNRSIQQYTNDLESSLETYSKKLQRNLDQQLDGLNRKTIVLNPFSKDYQTIQTNTGTFLIAVERLEPIEGGVRLHINIGNPNYADYRNFKLKFFWGRKRVGEYAATYGQWRQSLKGFEFTFNGKIEKGKWNSMAVDLTPVSQGDLGYLECALSVSSIELGVE